MIGMPMHPPADLPPESIRDPSGRRYRKSLIFNDNRKKFIIFEKFLKIGVANP